MELDGETVKLDPFMRRLQRKMSSVKRLLKQELWDQAVKESFRLAILTLECLVMDYAGAQVLEQLRRNRKIYLDPLIGVLESKGLKVANITELEKLRVYRNRLEHETETAGREDAEWAYETAKALIQKYYPNISGQLEEENEGREEPKKRVKVADEVWIACALLHKEKPHRRDFSTREIIEKVHEENIYGTLRPGVYVHVSQHCVANKKPNPGKYRMLFETEPGRRRLFRKGDPYHPEREGGKITPNKNEIPKKYWYLIDWYENEYNKNC